MKTLYLECSMGAAGDMLAAALLELLPEPDRFVERLNQLGIPGVRYTREPSVKCGIIGTHLTVTVQGQQEHSRDDDAVSGSGVQASDAASHAHTHGAEHVHSQHTHTHPHAHHTMADITALLYRLELPQQVRSDALAVYQRLAQAESRVHGQRVEQIHFHEVGSLDAVADITAVCLLLHELAPERIVASPVHTGSGQVHCAHGILPVPAPATALLLEGIPSCGGNISGELCTPTGAALLGQFVQSYGPQPLMRVEKIGCGMGQKDFPQANCLRAMLGEGPEQPEEPILELRCCLDDMTPEAVGFAQQCLLEAGALEVFTTPIGMKKCRPGTLLTVLCRTEDRDTMLRLLFRHTATLGVRENVCSRYTLARETRTAETSAGSVRLKRASGWGVTREKPEYEDVARIAREQGCSLAEAEAFVRAAL